MDEWIIQIALGGIAGLGVALTGYATVLKTEKFEFPKFALTVGIGAISGAALSTGFLNVDALIMIFQAAGLGIIAQNVVKSVYRYFQTTPEAKEVKEVKK